MDLSLLRILLQHSDPLGYGRIHKLRWTSALHRLGAFDKKENGLSLMEREDAEQIYEDCLPESSHIVDALHDEEDPLGPMPVKGEAKIDDLLIAMELFLIKKNLPTEGEGTFTYNYQPMRLSYFQDDLSLINSLSNENLNSPTSPGTKLHLIMDKLIDRIQKNWFKIKSNLRPRDPITKENLHKALQNSSILLSFDDTERIYLYIYDLIINNLKHEHNNNENNDELVFYPNDIDILFKKKLDKNNIKLNYLNEYERTKLLTIDTNINNSFDNYNNNNNNNIPSSPSLFHVLSRSQNLQEPISPSLRKILQTPSNISRGTMQHLLSELKLPVNQAIIESLYQEFEDYNFNLDEFLLNYINKNKLNYNNNQNLFDENNNIDNNENDINYNNEIKDDNDNDELNINIDDISINENDLNIIINNNNNNDFNNNDDDDIETDSMDDDIELIHSEIKTNDKKLNKIDHNDLDDDNHLPYFPWLIPPENTKQKNEFIINDDDIINDNNTEEDDNNNEEDELPNESSFTSISPNKINVPIHPSTPPRILPDDLNNENKKDIIPPIFGKFFESLLNNHDHVANVFRIYDASLTGSLDKVMVENFFMSPNLNVSLPRHLAKSLANAVKSYVGHDQILLSDILNFASEILPSLTYNIPYLSLRSKLSQVGLNSRNILYRLRPLYAFIGSNPFFNQEPKHIIYNIIIALGIEVNEKEFRWILNSCVFNNECSNEAMQEAFKNLNNLLKKILNPDIENDKNDEDQDNIIHFQERGPAHTAWKDFLPLGFHY